MQKFKNILKLVVPILVGYCTRYIIIHKFGLNPTLFLDYLTFVLPVAICFNLKELLEHGMGLLYKESAGN
jgi:ACR3 family arsenite efflux pump ArsB